MSTRSARVGRWLMVGCAASWAVGLVMSKHVLDTTEVAPIALLVVQLVASIGALALGCLVGGAWPRGTWRAGWVGLLEPGIAYPLDLAGLALTSAASASVLGSLEPALVPLLAWALLRQRPTAPSAVVVLGATGGAALVALGAGGGERSLLGDLLVLGSVVAAALYVVVASRQVTTASPLPIALVQQVWALGLIVVLAGGLALLGAGGFGGFTPAALAWAVASGVVSYALPFGLYLSALTRLPVARAATYLTLIPVFGVVLAVVLLGERLTILQLVGSALVVTSLRIGTLLDDRRTPTTPIDEPVRVRGS